LPAERVELQKPAVEVVVGDAHSCALHTDGTISCWGHNERGQVGVPRDEQ
jgi:alpha-tubulin suppressor-like RCC1 family protein